MNRQGTDFSGICSVVTLGMELIDQCVQQKQNSSGLLCALLTARLPVTSSGPDDKLKCIMMERRHCADLSLDKKQRCTAGDMPLPCRNTAQSIRSFDCFDESTTSLHGPCCT